ncbi:Hypothetical predicted protein [Paramuricea clavata]|uniref:Uncharacterized protein n=1 Tax=Paramuricea clavata TaxID=317549 RepID=A0A7D9IMM1_PARCT|nr:Hypothetical predicted protein [Paramuricea clavata]
MKKTSKELRRFTGSRLRRPLDKIKTLSMENILAAVRNETLFGCVECNIHVPDNLRDHFQEMCPIFKTIDISRDDIGKFMKTYAEENNIMRQPRRSLIGSMVGKKILAVGNRSVKVILSAWVTAVEHTPKPCFKPFGDALSDARRTGDVDLLKAIIANTMNLLGNSSYGKTITNKERHRQVK